MPASARTGGWEENQKAGSRLENYLGLNYYFPPETLWLGTRRVSRPVRAAAAAPERLPPALEYYVRVRGKKEGGGAVVGVISTYVDQILEEALLRASIQCCKTKLKTVRESACCCVLSGSGEPGIP